MTKPTTLGNEKYLCIHRIFQVVREGLVLLGKTTKNKADSSKGFESGAESGAATPRFIKPSSDLRKIIDSWPNLPAATRKAIVALVQAEKGLGG